MKHLLQDLDEFEGFCQLLVAENVRSYLEIGSCTGGSIELVASVLPKGSRLVAVDKPWDNIKEARLREVIQKLRHKGYDAHLIKGDSADPKIISAAQKLGPYDAVFIDGEHQLSYVRSDWLNYGAMGRVVGFHDIARDMPKNSWGGPHQSATFWQSLKGNYRHVEFISEETRARTDNVAVYGIGVVWNGSQVQQAAGTGSA